MFIDHPSRRRSARVGHPSRVLAAPRGTAGRGGIGADFYDVLFPGRPRWNMPMSATRTPRAPRRHWSSASRAAPHRSGSSAAGCSPGWTCRPRMTDRKRCCARPSRVDQGAPARARGPRRTRSPGGCFADLPEGPASRRPDHGRFRADDRAISGVFPRSCGSGRSNESRSGHGRIELFQATPGGLVYG